MAEQKTVPHRSTDLPVRSIRVEVIRGPDQGKTFTAKASTVTVGTAPGNDVVLTDTTVSRYHLELGRHESGISVQDHGSTNGTTLGTARIERAVVHPGTQLVLGKTTLKVDDGETVQLELHDDDHLGRLRGRSPVMRELMARIKRAAQSDASVLLLGETGTGKELIAHALHECGPRATAPFETVDCGALMPTLIASELFGHERGAFTGADRQHIGAFERADGGTLFLDEIGELPANVQAALLGALERRSFRRLGGQTPLSVNVRVISATHRDLRAEVNAGTFRQDLYYRIAVLHFRVPPLRERKDDISLLVEQFMRDAGFAGDIDEILPETAIASLSDHHWPGNVRELRNFVEAAVAMGEAPHLEEPPPPPGEQAEGVFRQGALEKLSKEPYSEAKAALLQEFEAYYLKRLMERAKGNVSQASRDAKMDRSHLMQMLKRHEIE